MRTFIFLALVFVVLAPMALVVQNRERVAFERELAKVEQAHLIIAQNLASSMQRFATDLTTTFEFLSRSEIDIQNTSALSDLLSVYGVYAVAELDEQSTVIRGIVGSPNSVPSSAIVRQLQATAVATEANLSGVYQVGGQPTMYVYQKTASGSLLIGTMDTSYVRTQQKQIAFGDRGHAMVVDQNGRVLGHPKQQWTDISKDASGLEVVQRMVSRQTGVMQFFSPPLQADMIAGYTFVPATGWGVMVPQPISELHDAAMVEVKELIWTLAFLFVLASAVAWVLSGLIVRPLKKISQTVQDVQSGNISARVPDLGKGAPLELASLRLLLNGVMDEWSQNRDMLESSLEAAKAANTHKAHAISVLSHEMRTPLNGVLGGADLLKGSNLDRKQLRYLDMIITSAHSLLDHVNDVLEIGRLGAKHNSPTSSQIDIRAMFTETRKKYARKSEAKGVRFSQTVSENVPRLIVADFAKVRNIIANLTSNAVKFTDQGYVDVTAKMSALDRLSLTVKDTGCGIPIEDLGRIFEPFSMVDASFNRQQSGTGLGLSIVKLSVESMGGTVEVQSTDGVGSTFRVEVPVTPFDGEPPQAATSNTSVSEAYALQV
ncbi:hypothetical protein NBRC116594_23960 [Shimia sp. NS0008-38b]|uniref:sensor histidine kinase n=1 Tax=Shimia sp. NS0008-38b TaxID=3127653 RepID=UPI003104C6D7